MDTKDYKSSNISKEVTPQISEPILKWIQAKISPYKQIAGYILFLSLICLLIYTLYLYQTQINDLKSHIELQEKRIDNLHEMFERRER